MIVAKIIEEVELVNYKVVMHNKEKLKWIEAIKYEMKSLFKNGNWILVDKVADKKLVGCKLIFKEKERISRVGKARYEANLLPNIFL